jgi:phosphopantetheinyl transferase
MVIGNQNAKCQGNQLKVYLHILNSERMPLIHTEQGHHETTLSIWEIHEDLEFFRNNLDLNTEDEDFLNNIHPRRAIEWAASRYLLKTLISSVVPFSCLHDHHGRPYIPDDPRYISISHSYGMAAVGISHAALGIDIQRETEKINRIQTKFIGDAERATIGPDPASALLHLAWSAKEAMFKLYSRGEIDFKKHLQVNLPQSVDRYGMVKGTISKHEEYIACDIHYRFIHGYIWVYALASEVTKPC